MLVLSPFEQTLNRFLAVALVRRTGVAACEVFHPRVGVLVGDVRGVPAFPLPDEPVEPVHPVGTRLDGPDRVALRLVGLLPEGEQPVETRLSFGSVVEQLAGVRVLLRGVSDDREFIQIAHERRLQRSYLRFRVNPANLLGLAGQNG